MLYRAIKQIMLENYEALVDHAPSAFAIQWDTGGKWKFEDMELLQVTNAAKELMPKLMSTNLTIQDEAKRQAVQGAWGMVRDQYNVGYRGWMGPFPYDAINAQGNEVYVHWHVLYLGKMDGKRVFMVLSFDKTAERYRERMEQAEGTNINPYLKLTAAEQCVGMLIEKGKRTCEIADELSVSKRTIDAHRLSIRRKLGITERNQSIFQYLREK